MFFLFEFAQVVGQFGFVDSHGNGLSEIYPLVPVGGHVAAGGESKVHLVLCGWFGVFDLQDQGAISIKNAKKPAAMVNVDDGPDVDRARLGGVAHESYFSPECM